MSRHLLVALSGHGFGHVAQAAPVVDALARRYPGVRVSLYTAAPEAILASRFQVPFERFAIAPDVGAIMDSALDVKTGATADAYGRFHADWDGQVEAECGRLAQWRPDLVLADAPYRVLAAARRLGIPALGLCSLNWADIYGHYCRQVPDAAIIHRQILDAYNDADAFLCPQPSMPMPDLRRRRELGPIARLGRAQREVVRRRLGRSADRIIVLVTMGGIETRNPLRCWPQRADIVYLVPAPWHVDRPDCVAVESLGLHFSDLLASCDLVLTKPGYNTFVEAACHGVPVLYVERGDWPEQPYLTRWLERHGRCRRITRAQLENGDFAEKLRALPARPVPPVPRPDGVAQAVEILRGYL